MQNQDFIAQGNEQIQGPLSQELIQYLVLNKLCYDNEIFLIKDSKLLLNRDEVIYKIDQKQQENKIDQYIEYLQNIFKFDKNSNLYYMFLKVFITFLFLYLPFGPITFFASSTLDRELFTRYRGLVDFSLATLGWGTSFFWTYVAYGAREDEKNSKFYGINALTLTQSIYCILILASGIIIAFYIEKSKDEGDIAIEELEISSDELFFETMDRNNIKNISELFIKKDFVQLNSIYSFIEDHNQPISDTTNIMTQQLQQNLTIPKTWNSGFILKSPSANFGKIKFQNEFYIFQIKFYQILQSTKSSIF